MNCRQAQEHLPAYLEVGYSNSVPEVRSHLETCESCSSDLKRYEETMSGLRTLPELQLQPPAWLLSSIQGSVGALAVGMKRRQMKRKELMRPRNAAYATSVLFAAGVAGAFLFRGRRRRRLQLSRRLQQSLAA